MQIQPVIDFCVEIYSKQETIVLEMQEIVRKQKQTNLIPLVILRRADAAVDKISRNQLQIQDCMFAHSIKGMVTNPISLSATTFSLTTVRYRCTSLSRPLSELEIAPTIRHRHETTSLSDAQLESLFPGRFVASVCLCLGAANLCNAKIVSARRLKHIYSLAFRLSRECKDPFSQTNNELSPNERRNAHLFANQLCLAQLLRFMNCDSEIALRT